MDVLTLYLYLLFGYCLDVVIAVYHEGGTAVGAGVILVLPFRRRCAFLISHLAPRYAQRVPISVGTSDHESPYYLSQMLLVLSLEMYQAMHVFGHDLKRYVFDTGIYGRVAIPALFHLASELCEHAPWCILGAIFRLGITRQVSEYRGFTSCIEGNMEPPLGNII